MYFKKLKISLHLIIKFSIARPQPTYYTVTNNKITHRITRFSRENRQTEWGESPREWVTVKPLKADKSDTPSLARDLPSPGHQ